MFGLFHGGGRDHADQNKYDSLETLKMPWLKTMTYDVPLAIITRVCSSKIRNTYDAS